jgi:hypothetical protein
MGKQLCVEGPSAKHQHQYRPNWAAGRITNHMTGPGSWAPIASGWSYRHVCPCSGKSQVLCAVNKSQQAEDWGVSLLHESYYHQWSRLLAGQPKMPDMVVMSASHSLDAVGRNAATGRSAGLKLPDRVKISHHSCSISIWQAQTTPGAQDWEHWSRESPSI